MDNAPVAPQTPPPPPEEVLDVRQGVHMYLARHPFYTFFGIVVPICISILIDLPFLAGEVSGVDAMQHRLVASIVPLVIASGVYLWIRRNIEIEFYQELATMLDCTYEPESDPPTDGQLFSLGHSHQMRNVLSGTYGSIPYQMADYVYVTGSGKSQQSHYYRTASFTFSATLPRLLCRPKRWSLILDEWKPSGYRELSLEGNFNDSFVVYVPQEQEMEALQVLEPNVMAKLLDGFPKYGFECIGSHVYLFSKGVILEDRQTVLDLFALVKRFCDLLAPEIGTFVRESVTHPS